MNQLSKGNTNTVDETAAADIAAGTGTFENGLFKFYTRDTEAGRPVAPNVANTRVLLTKQNQADAYAIGDPVHFDEVLQQAVLPPAGALCGVCAKASDGNALQVDVRINE